MSTQTLPDDQAPSSATSLASLHRLTLPGPMLQRGFWLYVWRVQTPKGERLYVGRTGDSSSPHATAPYTRVSPSASSGVAHRLSLAVSHQGHG